MAMGIFGLGEVLTMLEGGEAKKESLRLKAGIRDLLPDRNDWKTSSMPIARGSVLGFFLGLIPGGGAVLASFISYAVEKRYSKRKEEFGSGVIEGVAGPESANNSAAIGAFVPLLSLGIPANPVMALLFAALMIHGLEPGPLLVRDNPGFFWGVLTSMYIGNVLLLILNVPLIGLLVKVLRVPDYIMAPTITIVCLTGAYSLNNDPSSILIVSIFGLIGYLMRKYEYDPAPLVPAFVLGPVMENSLRQSLKMFQGDVFQMISRPVVMVILLSIVLLFVSPVVTKQVTKVWRRRYSYSN
ncbi:MAG: tripartite tricarboxylate transporter permease [Burkholderiaceae bacterium]|nr:tripartite tricarboxylate transporter permease [Burkholderiaceae bacterium]